MPPRVNKNAPRKDTAKKQVPRLAPSKKGKRKAHTSDEESSGNDEPVVQQPAKKRSRIFQQDSEGEDDGSGSEGGMEEVDDTGGEELGGEPKVCQSMKPCRNINIPLSGAR